MDNFLELCVRAKKEIPELHIDINGNTGHVYLKSNGKMITLLNTSGPATQQVIEGFLIGINTGLIYGRNK